MKAGAQIEERRRERERVCLCFEIKSQLLLAIRGSTWESEILASRHY